jgi:endonuclease I
MTDDMHTLEPDDIDENGNRYPFYFEYLEQAENAAQQRNTVNPEEI